ncbi:glycosyltransferase family 2 protein, partial [Patescibacteria group bacterium]|nr:glycosyltransferase family 2 protein [Patescibacteria group bacterium]
IVVDNASSDDTVTIIEKKYPNAILIKNDINAGFGVANNIGVAHAHGELIFFLNVDVKLPPNLLRNLVDFKKTSGANIVSPQTIDSSGVSHYNGEYLCIDLLGYPGMSKKLFYIEGCCLMISRKDFETLGKFDEAYFMYAEDIDLCWRAHLLGMSLAVANNISMFHFGGGSGQSNTSTHSSEGLEHKVPLFRRYEVEKNTLRNLLKLYSWNNLIWAVPLYLVLIGAEITLYLILFKYAAGKKLAESILWNIRNISATLDERSQVQKKRKVLDTHIFRLMEFRLFKLDAFKKVGVPKYI